MSRRVHQLLPAAHAGDATGDSAQHLTTALRDAGYDAETFALTIDAELEGIVHPMDSFPEPRAGDLTLLHFAIPSPLSQLLIDADGMRGIVYHNLTPAEMLAPYCPDIANLTARGALELEMLASSGRIDVAIGVSDFNCRGLTAAGFDTTTTLPLAVDLDRYDLPADPIVAAQRESRPTTFLTVGRVAPNKRLETFLRAAAYYVRHVEPDAEFVIIGGNRGMEAYSDALVELAGEIGLDRRLRWLGRVPHEDLVAWYRNVDVYLCTSAHEGFCAPLLEAMHFGIPILARHAAAIPETLGAAGVTFTDDDPAALAELMHLLATDDGTRQVLRARGLERLREFAPDRVTRRWVEFIEQTLGKP